MLWLLRTEVMSGTPYRPLLVFLGGLAWIVIGTVWLLHTSSYDTYCRSDMLIFSITMLVIQWALAVMSFFFSCNVSFKVARPKIEDSSDHMMTPINQQESHEEL